MDLDLHSFNIHNTSILTLSPNLWLQDFIMQLFSILTLGLAAMAAAVPVSEEANAALTARDDRGSYTVSGLGSRKQAILNAGGNTLDIAIAMLEDEHMSTGYTYGTGPKFSHQKSTPR